MNTEEIRKQIIREYGRDNTDWDRLEGLVTELGDAINDKVNPEETLLSELFGDYSYKDGGKLLRLVKLFLRCGYDVRANNGFNGGMCLCQLCWASYDRYILDIAKLLLDEGADPFFEMEDEDYGVVSCISWKFGYWAVGDLECANLFEAYYDLIDAAKKGEDYHCIYTAYKCMDKPLCRIEKGKYDDREDFVLWFGDVPLVISPWVDFVVNPNKAGKYAEKYDVTEDYSEIYGAKLKEIIYFGQCAAAIILDNGKNMVFMKNSAKAEVHKAHLKICDESECNADITGITAEKIYVSGNNPSSAYDEIYLMCGNRRYLISSIGVDYEEHYLVCIPVDAEQMEGLDGRLKCSPAKVKEIRRYPDGRIKAIHMVSDKHIYLAATEFRGVKVLCNSQPVEDVWEIEYHQEIEKVKLCWEI